MSQIIVAFNRRKTQMMMNHIRMMIKIISTLMHRYVFMLMICEVIKNNHKITRTYQAQQRKNRGTGGNVVHVIVMKTNKIVIILTRSSEIVAKTLFSQLFCPQDFFILPFFLCDEN